MRPEVGAVALHTGEAKLDPAGVPLGWLLLLFGIGAALLPLLLLCAWADMWRRSRIEVRTSARVCRNEHNWGDNLVASHEHNWDDGVAACDDYGVLRS